jgi:KDO2-lipid IV(A) lauroyltransferase
MRESQYSFRANSLSAECTFRIVDNAIHWNSGRTARKFPYSEIREVCTVRQLARGNAVLKGRVITSLNLIGQKGERITLSPLHYSGHRTWADRSDSYGPFVDALLADLKKNPKIKLSAKDGWLLRMRNVSLHALPPFLGSVGNGILRATRFLGLERASSIGGRTARLVGPVLPATHVARANLRAAFPEHKSEEIERILQGVWDNFGRVIAECAFADELSSHDRTSACQNRIALDASTIQRVIQISDSGKPCLFFGAHLGSWELGSLAAAFNLRLAALFRPFKNPALDDLIVRARPGMKLIPSRMGAATQIDDCIKAGWSIGMLVDQHFSSGVEVSLFGRPCKVNPTIAKLARKFELPIYGVRVIRTKGSRFIGELTPPLSAPRDKDGKIDVKKTMQMISDTLEKWIREHPDQWLWLHRRWR